MRIAKGKKITDEDHRELRLFGEMLQRLADGQSQMQAYAETYGEVLFEQRIPSTEERR